jgi:enamine deaminase RidA (YjgF/YER057c/UK114 family)
MHLWRQTLDVQTSNTIHNMEKRLRAVCHASDANVDNVVKVSIFFQLYYQL